MAGKIIWASTTAPTYAVDRETGEVLPLDAVCPDCGVTFDQGDVHECGGDPDGSA